MLYQPELFYLQDQKHFPLRKALLTTAQTVGSYCNYYYARLIAPKKTVTTDEQKGKLPEGAAEKKIFIAELVTWLFENTECDALFALFLDEEPVPRKGEIAKFDHHDDTGCWVLKLDEAEYGQLQRVWKEKELPSDLFYPQEQSVDMPYSGSGLKGKVLKKLGVRQYYTPKQWQAKQNSSSVV